ncbi:MAG: class I SAM-dependent methyltransferase [Actinomycetota bacterium]|nr:class I SAM-dependent methyltransferase [Actinomycetota bacterium]
MDRAGAPASSRKGERVLQASSGEPLRLGSVYEEHERSATWQRRRDLTNPGTALSRVRRMARLEAVLRRRFTSVEDLRVLDVGCGEGWLLDWFRGLGIPAEQLVGVDLVAGRIEVARRTHPDITFLEANAEHLDFLDGPFDLVVLFTVMSSILDADMAANVARSVDRVLAPGGAVVWFDLRYPIPYNRTTRPMTRKRVAGLFPGYGLELHRETVVPPLARRLGALAPIGFPILEAIPVLNTHYLGLLTRP